MRFIYLFYFIYIIPSPVLKRFAQNSKHKVQIYNFEGKNIFINDFNQRKLSFRHRLNRDLLNLPKNNIFITKTVLNIRKIKFRKFPKFPANSKTISRFPGNFKAGKIRNPKNNLPKPENFTLFSKIELLSTFSSESYKCFLAHNKTIYLYVLGHL